MKPLNRRHLIAHCTALFAIVSTATFAATPLELLTAYEQASGQRADATAGKTFFNSKHGREWSCATCHTATPTTAGKHVTTAKPITPLAPSADATRLTDGPKVEKWFRRNCNDVVGRECAASEKANVLAWLISIK